MSKIEQEIEIIPDPAILQVLTYLEMQPIHSLCELIDNSIDAMAGATSGHKGLIIIDLPSRNEIEEGSAMIRVRDNGPGMSLDQLKDSLKAGYSSKAKHGSLGLFGVGFNIATGKLGRLTRVITARKEDDFAVESQIDLVMLRRSGTFKLKAIQRPKPEGLTHGTIIEISSPWPSGNQNHGYMHKLVSIGRPKIIGQLGRIYSSLLKGTDNRSPESKSIRILVGEHTVEPFHHCIWGESRSVDTQKHGKVPAVIRYSNHVIHVYNKCAQCNSIIQHAETHCADPECGSSSFTTIHERISGWLGIQRYSDSSHYGIDLIRNGRAIKTLVKEIFFEFTDPDSGETILDYPIDQRDGRIIGEIHIDHVPVDPTKQNFEQSSPEWRRAVEFLRGNSSLQPTQPNADRNASPIFKLYQGYRKVRGPGKRSLSMGKWTPGSTQAILLSKNEIDELRKKFDNKEPGYFDDAEWWRLVESADEKPVPGLRMCSSCHLECSIDLNECPHCNHIFSGKLCLNNDCKKTISFAAITCGHCGANQVIEVQQPWTCKVCTNVAGSDQTSCPSCHAARGAANPVSREGLLAQCQLADGYTIPKLTIKLASGEMSASIDVKVYLSPLPIVSIHRDGSQVRLPSVRFVEDSMEIFLDPTHPYFEIAGTAIEYQIATEAAYYLVSMHGSQSVKFPAEHSITKLTFEILHRCWPDKFNLNMAGKDLEALFSSIKSKLADSIGDQGSQVYHDLGDEEKTALAFELVKRGRDLAELNDLKISGQFIQYLKPKNILAVFRTHPKLFFDGKVWAITFADIPQIDPNSGEKLQAQLRGIYGSLLETVSTYAEKGIDNRQESELISAACKLLWMKLHE